MAIKKGRISVEFAAAFPKDLILMGPVEPVIKFNPDRTAQKVQETDLDYDGVPITGLRKWKILVTDPDAEDKRSVGFELILLTDYQPVVPDSARELIPGSGTRLIQLEGLTIEPRVMDAKRDQYSWQGWTYRATGFIGDTNTPKPNGRNGSDAKAGA